MPGLSHEPSHGTALGTVTNWKQCQQRLHFAGGGTGFGFRSKRPQAALEHLHVAERAKGKTSPNELLSSEYALPLAVLCLFAHVCTYTCMYVHTHTLHLTLNTEVLPYIPGYFFFHKQACMCTCTHKGCLLPEVTKQATGPSLLQWEASIRRLDHIPMKEKQWLQSPDTTTFQHQTHGKTRILGAKCFYSIFSGKEILPIQLACISSQ